MKNFYEKFKSVILPLLFIVIVLIVFAFIKSCHNGKAPQPTPTPKQDTITFEKIVTSDYNYIDSAFENKDKDYTHFYEVRAYLPTSVDSAEIPAKIDSLVTIFAVGQKVWFFQHKIIDNKVKTDTVIYNGPFVEDCEMPWPVNVTFNQMLQIVKDNKLKAPNKDVTLRRALIWHPKEYPDFTIGTWNAFYFISTKDGSVRTQQ